jgi:hypothetical protein
MTSGKPRRITWPRLCHPFRSDDFCMRPHCNQFSSCPKIFLQRQSLDRLHLRLNYLLIQPLLFLSQSEGPIAQGHYRWPLAKFGETIAKKFTRMGSDWQFRFSRPMQHVKYMSYLPPSTVLFFTLLYSGFLSNRRQSQRLLLSRSAVAMPT